MNGDYDGIVPYETDSAASQRIMEFMQQRRKQFTVEQHDFAGFAILVAGFIIRVQ
jgi:hypothetical protein